MTKPTNGDNLKDIINILIDKKGISEGEMLLLLEHKEIFIKFIDMYITDVRIGFANLKYVNKEATGYLSIQICEKMKKDLESSLDNYKLLVKERQEQEKSNK